MRHALTQAGNVWVAERFAAANRGPALKAPPEPVDTPADGS
jgi:hypothetical protein